MMFYQAPSYYNAPPHHPYHQAMFMHYAQPVYRSRAAESAGAFAVGDSIAAGTYLRGE